MQKLKSWSKLDQKYTLGLRGFVRTAYEDLGSISVTLCGGAYLVVGTQPHTRLTLKHTTTVQD